MKNNNSIFWIVILLVAIVVSVCGCSTNEMQISNVKNILNSDNSESIGEKHIHVSSPTPTPQLNKYNSNTFYPTRSPTQTPVPSPTPTPTPEIVFEKTLEIKGSSYWDKILKNKSRLIFIDKKYCKSGYLVIYYKIENPKSKVYMLMTTESDYQQYLEYGTWTSYGFGNPILSGNGAIRIYPRQYTLGKTGLVLVPNVIPYGTTSKIYFKIEHIP